MCFVRIGTALPRDTTVRERPGRAQQEIGEQREAEESEKVCVRGKMSAADSSEKKRVQDHPQRAGHNCRLPMSVKSAGDSDREAGEDQDKLNCTKRGEAQRRGEQEREVLGPTFAELGEGAIHAGADGVAAEAEEYSPARAFYGPSQGDVFEQIAGNGGVSADRIVGLARDQDVLPVGGGGGRVGIAHL